MKPEEIRKMIVELGKKDMPSEKIGLILRDQHGIPKVKNFGLKIGKILKEEKIKNNSHKENVERKLEILKKHFEKNKHDYKANRSIVKQTGKLNKIRKLS